MGTQPMGRPGAQPGPRLGLSSWAWTEEGGYLQLPQAGRGAGQEHLAYELCRAPAPVTLGCSAAQQGSLARPSPGGACLRTPGGGQQRITTGTRDLLKGPSLCLPPASGPLRAEAQANDTGPL